MNSLLFYKSVFSSEHSGSGDGFLVKHDRSREEKPSADRGRKVLIGGNVTPRME